MPSSRRHSTFWDILRIWLSSVHRSSVRHILRLWLFVKRHILRRGGSSGLGGPKCLRDSDSPGCKPDVQRIRSAGERESTVVYSSKIPEPFVSHLGLHMEHSPHPRVSRDLSSRPSSVAYPNNTNDDERYEPYSISVQNASQTSIDIADSNASDYGRHERDADAQEHLQAPSSRASSRASSRRTGRIETRMVSGATSARAISRTRSREHSPAHRFSQSRFSISSISPSIKPSQEHLPDEKSSVHSRANRAVPTGATPFPAPLPERIRKVQKVYPIVEIKRYERNIILCAVIRNELIRLRLKWF